MWGFKWKDEDNSAVTLEKKRQEEQRKGRVLRDLFDAILWTVKESGKMISQREFVKQFGVKDYELLMESMGEDGWDVLEKKVAIEYEKMTDGKKLKLMNEYKKRADKDFCLGLRSKTQNEVTQKKPKEQARKAAVRKPTKEVKQEMEESTKKEGVKREAKEKVETRAVRSVAKREGKRQKYTIAQILEMLSLLKKEYEGELNNGLLTSKMLKSPCKLEDGRKLPCYQTICNVLNCSKIKEINDTVIRYGKGGTYEYALTKGARKDAPKIHGSLKVQDAAPKDLSEKTSKKLKPKELVLPEPEVKEEPIPKKETAKEATTEGDKEYKISIEITLPGIEQPVKMEMSVKG